MTTIKRLLDSLPAKDKRTLDYAFEHGLQQFFLLPDGRYIGVNCQHISYLIPEMTTGTWSVGSIKDIPEESYRILLENLENK